MALLVDDVSKAREALIAGARERGLRVLQVDPGRAPAIDVEVDDLDAFLDQAKALDGAALYLASLERPPTMLDPARTDRAQQVLAQQIAEAKDDRERDMVRAIHRMGQLLQQGAYPTFHAAFLRGAYFHRLYVADRVAWPAMARLAGASSDDASEDDDHEEPCFEDLDVEQGAEAVLRHLLEDGMSRAEMRRDPARLARRAVEELETHLVGDADAASHLRAIQKAAENRMRRGR